MNDLFDREQRVYDRAAAAKDAIKNGTKCCKDEFTIIVDEYGRLLRQMRRITRLSDKTTDNLNTSKLDLQDKVHYDALTAIHNRRFMEEGLARFINAISRAGGKLSIMMLDVDFFKRYNDTYGHNKGDECLKAIAYTINKNITRTDDFVARYGGEEFIVVLPFTDEGGARLIADKLLGSIRACNIPHTGNEAADRVTISIGVTTGTVAHGQIGADYIRRADEALYISKQSGRNRYTFLRY